jgi:hypothetical protein
MGHDYEPILVSEVGSRRKRVRPVDADTQTKTPAFDHDRLAAALSTAMGGTTLTTAGANHAVSFSPDSKYYVDTYSRVDAAPVAELRRTSDKSLVLELEKADITALVKAGWKPPEVFTAKGRDGETDIWGVIEDFDLLVVPGMDHGSGGAYGDHKRYRLFCPKPARCEPAVLRISGRGDKPQPKSTSATSGK